MNKILKTLLHVFWTGLGYSGIYFGLYQGIEWVSRLLLAYNIIAGFSLMIILLSVGVMFFIIQKVSTDLKSLGISNDDMENEEFLREIAEDCPLGDAKELITAMDLLSSFKFKALALMRFIYPIALIIFGSVWGYVMIFCYVFIFSLLKGCEEELKIYRKISEIVVERDDQIQIS